MEVHAVAAEFSPTHKPLVYEGGESERRAELSLPVTVSDKGVIDTWLERIILPARSFGSDLALPNDAGGDDGVDFAISVR